MTDTVQFSDVSVIGPVLTFVAKGLDVATANAIRRTVLADIPNVAIAFSVDGSGQPDEDDVKILKNVSSLHNEFLAHRISLLPVCLTEDEISDFKPESMRFEIHAKNTGRTPLLVTTADVVGYDSKAQVLGRERMKQIFPPNPMTGDFVLITKLKPNMAQAQYGDELSVEFRARLGTARSHARWSPVSMCTYNFVLDPERVEAGFQDFLASNQSKGRTDKELRMEFDAMEALRCYKVDARGEPAEIRFAIQTECLMRPEFIFWKALRVLSADLQSFRETLEAEQPPADLEVGSLGGDPAFFHVTVTRVGFDHTLGNLLQTRLYDRYVAPKKVLAYAGYYIVHPLEDTLVFKLRFDGPKSVKDVVGFLSQVCSDIIQGLDDLALRWVLEMFPALRDTVREVRDFLPPKDEGKSSPPGDAPKQPKTARTYKQAAAEIVQ
jgi:DNA-directed RNA polymerase subunit L